MVLREIHTRFGDFRAGYLWAIVEPLVHIVSFGVLISLLNHTTPLGSSLEIFIATGVMPFFVFRDAYLRVGSARTGNRALLFFPIVKVIDAVIARLLLEAATWFTIGVILILLFLALRYDALPHDPLGCLAALGGALWLGGGVGMVNSVIGEFSHAWEKTFGVLMRPIYLASGVMFLPSNVPGPVQDIIAYMPTAHCIDWFRAGFYEGYEGEFVSKPFIFLTGLVLWCVGLTADRLLRAHMESE